MNVHALRATQRMGFDYCSDGRGTHPHLPVWNAELIRCPQLPTTLPTLDELIGREGVTEDNVAAHLLELTREPRPAGHVFTLHAELEGMRLVHRLDQLVVGWKAQGWTLGRDAQRSTRRCSRWRCRVARSGPGPWKGAAARCLSRAPEFLGDVDLRGSVGPQRDGDNR